MPGDKNYAVNKTTLSNDNIKLMASDPSLMDKIRLDVNHDADKVYWYIKFNIALDPASVSSETMTVMETDGCILDTDVSYKADKNLIVISPVGSFKQDEYYILKISENVYSAKGQKLGSEINILFKLVKGKISEFQMLKKGTKVPKPYARPRSKTERKPYGAKIYSNGSDRFRDKGDGMLPYAPMSINVYVGVAGIILTLISLPVNIPWITAVCLAIVLAGVAHLVYQFTKKPLLSDFNYNHGAFLFNKEKYAKAAKYFAKAVRQNGDNEFAEYALNKVKFYKD